MASINHTADTSNSDRQYYDFEIEIARLNNRVHQVRVLRSPAGEAQEQSKSIIASADLENLLLRFEKSLLRSNRSYRRKLSDNEQFIQGFGSQLFDKLMVESIRSLYYSSLEIARSNEHGLRIKLRLNDPALAALPWEYLYDRRSEQYLALSVNSPIIRYLEVSHPPLPLKTTLPLRILALIANPNNLEALDVAKEQELVNKATKAIQHAGLLEVEWLTNVTIHTLQRTINNGPWHIVYFMGHGWYDDNRQEGYLAISDENGRSRSISATSVATLLSDQNSLRLVILNACEGARGSTSDLFSSSASILVQRGIPAVIAMQFPITDEVAIDFMNLFYENVTGGEPIDFAITEARKGISVKYETSLEWGIPVLHLRAPDGALFDISRNQQDTEKLQVLRLRRKYLDSTLNREHLSPDSEVLDIPLITGTSDVFSLPDFKDLLSDIDYCEMPEDLIRDNGRLIQQLLGLFEIPADFEGAYRGPIFTQYLIKLGYQLYKDEEGNERRSRVAFEQVIEVVDDIALELASTCCERQGVGKGAK